MPNFGIFRGFSENSFGNKLFAGQETADVGSSTQTFVFTVKTDNAGVSTSTQFRLPLTTSTGLDFVIEWGDGVVQRITSHTAPEITHTYPSIGTYQIQISGLLVGWSFNNAGDRFKLLNVFQWGIFNITVTGIFFGCANLTCTATDAPIITSTSLVNTFADCPNFNGAIGNWNVSSVTNMSSMFLRATSFNQPIDSWNVSNVTTMQNMFNGATAFNQNIGSWNVSNVTNMNAMLQNCYAFNQNIGSWNTSKVTDMTNMFSSNASNIFNFNISGWDVSKVTSMSGMFRSCSFFNQPIGSWNTTSVTNMSSMFENARDFNQDIGSWNVSNVTNFTSFMVFKTAANYSTANLNAIYNGWSSRSVKPNLSITFGTIKYTAAGVAGRLVLTSAPNNWTITDGGI